MTRKDTKSDSDWGPGHRRGNPVLIQSMCNTKTEDVHATVEQIQRLEQAGCDIIRSAWPCLPWKPPRRWLRSRRRFIFRWWRTSTLITVWPLPPWRTGADKIRINPGNIGDRHKVQAVVDRAREYGVPIRVASTAVPWRNRCWKNTGSHSGRNCGECSG